MEYNNHSYVMSSEYDNAFRSLVTAGWTEKTQGTVVEPIGHLSHVHLHRHEEGWTDYLDGEGEPVPSPGHYLVHENDLGFVVVFGYDSEEDLMLDWKQAEIESLKFDEECEEV